MMNSVFFCPCLKFTLDRVPTCAKESSNTFTLSLDLMRSSILSVCALGSWALEKGSWTMKDSEMRMFTFTRRKWSNCVCHPLDASQPGLPIVTLWSKTAYYELGCRPNLLAEPKIVVFAAHLIVQNFKLNPVVAQSDYQYISSRVWHR